MAVRPLPEEKYTGMAVERKIVHVDMDAFFASVEQREHPEYRGKPLVVGGSADGRGVVAAASYEARKFGIHSAMPAAHAYRLCPHAIFVHPRISFYRTVSRVIMDIFHEFTELVEPLSLDEAFLDVTQNKLDIPTATETAQAVRARIFEQTQLTASAGVAPNKFLAKVASDMHKPNGLTVIKPSMVAAVLKDLPVRKVPGIGKVTEKKMSGLGIRTTGDLQDFSESDLISLFGKLGSWYYRLCRGNDPRPVLTERVRRSVSCEDTFSNDSTDLFWMRDQLAVIAEKLATRLDAAQTSGRTVTLKVTYHDFEKVSRSRTFEHLVSDPATLSETAFALLHTTEAGERPIRLLGIGVSNLDQEEQTASPQTSTALQLELPFFNSRFRSGHNES